MEPLSVVARRHNSANQKDARFDETMGIFANVFCKQIRVDYETVDVIVETIVLDRLPQRPFAHLCTLEDCVERNICPARICSSVVKVSRNVSEIRHALIDVAVLTRCNKVQRRIIFTEFPDSVECFVKPFVHDELVDLLQQNTHSRPAFLNETLVTVTVTGCVVTIIA